MKLVDSFEFVVQGEGADWSFDVRMPGVEIGDKLCDIFDDINDRRKKAFAAIAMCDRIPKDVTFDDLRENPVIMGVLAESGLLDAFEVSRQDKAQIADLVRGLCSAARGLSDDQGAALSWESAIEKNPLYIREVLYLAGEALYGKLQGGVMHEIRGGVEKNS